jgi:hypothetical protein
LEAKVVTPGFISNINRDAIISLRRWYILIRTFRILFNGFTDASTDIKPDFLASGMWLCEKTFIMPAHDVNMVAQFTFVPAQ